jgi:MFS family permease/quinol monooxygenase YgiN
VAAPTGAFAPLRHPVFRSLWTAVLVANVGTWMQNVAAAWEMTSLTRSPTLVALVQSATSLPVVLVALPAGALADIVDRRRLLVACQAWIAAVATLLAGLAFAGALTPALLLGLTFLLGLGLAMWAPAWLATIPDLVPRPELPSAVTLGGVSVNTARAVGPAIGGVLLALAGTGAVFAANALLTTAAALAFARYGPRRESGVSAEHVTSAVLAGGRYVRFSPELRRVLWRTAAFMFGGSALWAMLPVVAREGLGLGSSGYGLLLACLGTGAVAVVPALSRLRAVLAPDAVAALSGTAFALGTLALALALPLGITCALLAVAGAGWTSTLAVFNTAAQQVLPAWVRARALAYYLLVVQGGLAAGSAVWGWLAGRTDPETALLAALAVLAASVLAGALRPLVRLVAEPLPLASWPDPLIAVEEPAPDDGPVLISVGYEVPPPELDAFLSAAAQIEPIRRRDGAIAWQLYRDLATPTRFVEVFETRSWGEHLRQHARSTLADEPTERALARWRVERDEAAAQHLVAVPLTARLRPLRTS